MKSEGCETYFPLQKSEGYFQQNGKTLFRVETTGRTVTAALSFFKRGVVRYSLSIDPGRERNKPAEGEGSGFELINPDFLVSGIEPSVSQDYGKILLEAQETSVEISLDPWRIAVRDKKRRMPLVSELPFDLDAHEGIASPPSGYGQKNAEPSENSDGSSREEPDVTVGTRVNLSLDPYESLFGLGEKFTDLDKRGQRIVCWNVNPYGAGRETAYKNIPFLVSTRGYGIFLNETCRSIWDIGRTSNFSLSIEADGPALDLFIIPGDSLKNILSKYSDMVGHAPLPPRWSFGLWISPFGEQRISKTGMNQRELLELADTIRSREIACDVIHIDPYWMGGTGLCHFQWDRSTYPDPGGLVRKLMEKGFRVCLWEHPYVEKDGEIYNEAADKGYLLKHADGSVYDTHLVYISPHRRKDYTESQYALGGIVDFSNPEAAEWYKSKHRPLLEMGVAAFKSDFGEMIPYDAHFFNGKTGRVMHNLFPLLYNRTVFEVIKEFQERPVVWGRSGYAGSQRYPVQWSGDPLTDFKSLAATIRGGLSYGLSGIPFWTFDLGGFKGNPTVEVYLRWTQVGLLLSHSRFHGTTPRLPWYYGEQAMEIVRDYVHLRYRLLPYIYAVSQEAVRTGLPVMRALALEFEQDPGSLAVDTEYMLGPSLLVVPVLNSEGEVKVYLPPGTWYEYWTGEKMAGPRLLNLSVGLDVLPIYVRSNAVIPRSEDNRIVSELWDSLSIDVYPDAEGRLEIPEEAGRQATSVEISRPAGGLRITASGPDRGWTVFLRDSGETRDVEISSSAAASRRYDKEAKTVEIIFEKCGRFEIDVVGS